MLLELEFDSYDRVRLLFSPIDYNLAINSILAGLSPGVVFADDLAEPRVALTWTQGRVFLAGTAADEAALMDVRSAICDRFYPEAAEKGLNAFSLHCSPGWETALERVLIDKHLMRDIRHYYALDASNRDWLKILPSEFKLRAVDERLLAREDLRGLDGVIEEMQSERPSVEEFLAKSVGCCAIREQTIAGWCMSEYNCDDRCEIGIYTADAHRKQGVATALAEAVIGRVGTMGIHRIGWHCWENNIASNASARKLGFALDAKYPVYFAYIDPLQNLAVNGIVSLRNGNPQRAVEWFEQAQRLGELPPWAAAHFEQAKTESEARHQAAA